MNRILIVLTLAFSGCATTSLQLTKAPERITANLDETKALNMMAKVPEGQWAIAPSFHTRPVAFLTERVVITQKRWGGPK